MIASWYPSEAAPLSGIFIQEQVRELSRHLDIAVLYVDLLASEHYVSFEREDRIPVVRVGSPTLMADGISPVARLRDLHSRSSGLIGAARRGLGVLEREGWPKPDLIHAQVLYPAGFIARSLSRQLRVPYVVTEHSSEFATGNRRFLRRNRSTRWLMRRASRDANKVMPVSTSLRDAMIECGVEADYEVVPNMVRDDFWPVALHEIVDRQMVHVSLLSDLSKNVSGLLRACGELRAEDEPPFRLCIVGDGWDRASLEALAGDLGLLPDVVTFEGRLSREDTLEVIRHSAFLVTSSHYETFSIATAEALMCGRPVVVTRCGGPEDYVTPQTGVLIPVRDQAALKAAVKDMLDRAGEYDSAAIAAYARSHLAPATVGQRILNIYRAVLAD